LHESVRIGKIQPMSETYGDADPAQELDPMLRPVWEDAPDETDCRPVGAVLKRRNAPSDHGSPAWLPAEAVSALLVPLCDAQDALARLDARAAAVPAPVREGLCAWMAFAEAAGWLAHAHAWAHPLDIALRDLGLTGSYSIATHVGRPMRDMPNTYVRRGTRAWEDQDAEGMMTGDQSVATALMLARQLVRLARTREDPFGSAASASAVLNQFGPEMLDSARFEQWRADIVWSAEPVPKASAVEGQGAHPLPPLLVAALAAERWMSGGIVDLPNALQALFAAAGFLVGNGALRVVIPPLWAAYPTLAQGDAGALPLLRSDVAAGFSSGFNRTRLATGLSAPARRRRPGRHAQARSAARGGRAGQGAHRRLRSTLPIAGRSRCGAAQRRADAERVGRGTRDRTADGDRADARAARCEIGDRDHRAAQLPRVRDHKSIG
jgi:hypothetical protein